MKNGREMLYPRFCNKRFSPVLKYKFSPKTKKEMMDSYKFITERENK